MDEETQVLESDAPKAEQFRNHIRQRVPLLLKRDHKVFA